MRLRFGLLVCLLPLATASLALAQTTGSVTGVARDTNGAPMPGVLVTISGPQMPLGRSMTTRSDGVFQFLNLVPGTYRLKADLKGLGSFQQEVVVAILKDTEVYPVLRPMAIAAVTVTAAVPLVDTKATDISTVTPRSTLEKLPLVRTFSGTFQLAPGIAESGVAISNTNVGVNAGGGRQDNTYLYDGVNVTNPFFGDLYQDFAELDIQEVNITRGGATPELGRTGGFIVNGVTKSGTNTLKGDVRLEYQPAAFEADSKDPNLQTKLQRFRPGVGAGGPLIRDHLFAYGSLNFYRVTETDRVNALGPVPDSKLDINEYFIKLSGQPNASQLIDASFRYRGIDQTYADIGSTDAGSTGDNPKEIDRVGVFSWFWTVNPVWNLEFKYNYDDYPSGATPVTPLPYQPPFNAADPASVGNFCDRNDICTGGTSLFSNDDNFQRQEFKLGTTYLTQGLGASHQIKVGATYSANKENLKRIANGWGAITFTTSASNCGTDSNGDALTCYRARYSPAQPAQISRGQTIGVYVQDQATWNRLTLNIGVLLNQDTYIPNDNGKFTFVQGDFTVPNSDLYPCGSAQASPLACTYQDTLTIPFSKQIQPRVGIAYETDPTVHDKAYVNYARYDNMDNQSLARAAAPIRLYRTDAFFDLTTGQLLNQVTRTNQTGKIVLPNIDPTFTDEFSLGYARPLGHGWSAEIWGNFRYTKNVIEDFPATGRQDDPSNFRYGNIPGWRKYRAVTLEVRKAYGSNWTMDVSYTLSRLVGNWDLDYATQLFYSSSYIEDGPGIYVEDPNRTGVLTGNRTHVAKVFASYTFPFRLNLGGYLRIQTGAPWQAQEFDPIYGTDYQYAEKAGSRTLPTWTNLDLLASYDFPIGQTTLRIEGRLLNVFNSQPVLNVNRDLYLNDDNTGPNPNFGQPFSDSSFAAYAPPRRFVLSAIFNF
ncbi:MAG TPA: carboxypeptidase regulatory-like domain-containing protein [Thermoanaerobaculia bacterium]|nr:carboxypeptidase regulatory-like domain-containing protein [Thermoanaerobaculia bacterium]